MARIKETLAAFLKAFRNNDPIEPPKGEWNAAFLMTLAGAAQAATAILEMEDQEEGLRQMSSADVESHFERSGKDVADMTRGFRDVATKLALDDMK